jgi:hypothetical protein
MTRLFGCAQDYSKLQTSSPCTATPTSAAWSTPSSPPCLPSQPPPVPLPTTNTPNPQTSLPVDIPNPVHIPHRPQPHTSAHLCQTSSPHHTSFTHPARPHTVSHGAFSEPRREAKPPTPGFRHPTLNHGALEIEEKNGAQGRHRPRGLRYIGPLHPCRSSILQTSLQL